jgi:hypothetical protein
MTATVRETGCPGIEVAWHLETGDPALQLVIDATEHDCFHEPGALCFLIGGVSQDLQLRTIEWEDGNRLAAIIAGIDTDTRTGPFPVRRCGQPERGSGWARRRSPGRSCGTVWAGEAM